MQDFRGLKVWQRANELAVAIRSTVRRFPRRGHSALAAQLTRAAESIAFNIAEGSATRTRREFARFLDISIRSASEVEAELQHARDCGALREAEWLTHTAETVEVRRMLCGLRRAVLRAAESPRRPTRHHGEAEQRGQDDRPE